MKLYVQTGGIWKQLPQLLSWEVCRSQLGCDSFTARLPFDLRAQEWLLNAGEVFFSEGGEVYFRALPDEICTAFTAAGRVTEVSGRGFAARLLDAQVPSAEFLLAQTEDILERYVRPLGIRTEVCGPLPAVEGFRVESGSSCYGAVEGFLRKSAGLRPRFTADGTLILGREQTGRVRLVQGGYVSLRIRQNRYGVPAEIRAVTPGTGETVTVRNAHDGLLTRREVVLQSTQPGSGAWKTPQERMTQALRTFLTVELTFPARFTAEPGDVLELLLPEEGLCGTYFVEEAVTCADAGGEWCRVTARPERLE